MKMSELEQRTGVNRETIRVFIRRGLLAQPERPKPTVAHYTEDHVRGILAIRQLQQNYHMTLNQIANVMQGRPLEQRVEATAFSHLQELVAAATGIQAQLVPIESLCADNPHAGSDAKAFEALRLMERIRSKGSYLVSQTDAQLLAIWSQMRAAGFDEAANFHPDTLDHYFKAADYLAHAEAEKFLARTEGRIAEGAAAEMLRTALPLMLDFFGLLRMKFFIRNIGLARSPEQAPRVRETLPQSPAAHSRRKPRRRD